MEITIDTRQFTQLAEFFRRMPDITREEVLRSITEIDLLVQGELVQAMPRGAGGLHGAGLAGSVFREEQVLADSVIGMVATPEPYAEYVEVGTKPHTPPIQPLMDWVVAKLGLRDDDAKGAAFAISKAIAKRGTRAQPVWQTTYQRLLPEIEAKLAQSVERIAARLAGSPA